MVDYGGAQIIDNVDEGEAWLEKIQFLSDAMESTSQPFAAGDSCGSILVFNEAFCRLTGYTREELYKINWATDLTVPETLEKELKALQVLDQTHQPQRYEKSYRRKDGTVIPVEILVHLASDSKGQPLFYYSFITDITERKQANKALRLAKFTINNTSAEVFWIEPNGHIFDVNIAASAALEYTPEELRRMYVWDIDPNYTREVWPSHWRELKERRVLKFESAQRSKSGRTFPTEVTVNYIEFEGTEYNCAVVRDITDHRQAEEALRESEEKFRTLAETASVGIMLFRNDKYIYTNPYMQNILGYSEDELLALNYWDVIHPEFRELARSRGHERLHGLPVPSRYELKVITKGGETRWGDYSAEVIKYGGQPTVIGVFYDITQRKRAEEALVKSESDLKKAQEIAHLSNWEWDLETDKVTGSEELYRMFGLIRDLDTFFNQYFELLTPEDRHRVLEARLATIKSGSPVSIDYQVVLPDGTRRFIHDEARAFYENGKPAKVFGIALDITERKQTEEALARDRYNLMKSQQIAHVGNWAWDVDTGELTGSIENDRIFGFVPGEGRRNIELVRSLIHPGDRAIMDSFAANVIRYGRRESVDYRIVKPDGSVRYLNTIADKVDRDELGKVTRVYGISQDITERKEAEKALRESEGMFRAFAESARAEIVLIKGNRFIYVNPERIRALGYTKEELLTMKVEDTIHPDMRETVRDRVRRRLRGEPVPSQYEVKMITKGGETLWEEISSTVIDYQGEPTILSMSFNITARKRAEQALKEAKMQAELYLDLMSHDITNMNQALMGNLEIMEVLSETGEIDRGLIDSSLKIINRSSRMITDVKKLTQVQTGKVPLRDVDLREILDAVKARYSRVPGRGIAINYPSGECCMVWADDLLRDVFDNLVDNAITHSTGPVTIDLTVDRVSLEGRRYYQVAVADTGPGIPDDLKKKIFLTIEEIEAGEKFKRRGFGLFLVRTLIEHYHGKVWAEDRVPGDYTKGARFVVLLPVAEK